MSECPHGLMPGDKITRTWIDELLRAIRRQRPVAGPGLRTRITPDGTVLTVTAAPERPANAGLAPFAVRFHAGQWEIYMPTGCVNVGGTCAALNPAASASGGDHAGDADGWRLLGLDESDGTAGTDGDGNTYREWTVTVHAKTSAKVYGVDALNASARRLAWAGVADALKESSSMTDAELYKDAPGDAFSCAVARVRVTEESDGEGETSTRRAVTPLRARVVDVGDVPAPTGFDLVWYFSVANGALKVEKVYCVRQLAAVAGISVTGDQMTDVTDAEDVYCRIVSPGLVQGRQLASVVADPPASDLSGEDYVTWLPLYHLNENTVTSDNRLHSFANVQLYRA